MLLEIKLSNFYSFKDEVTLDLRAGTINTKKAKEDLKDNIFSYRDEEFLKTIAIYGANASGKSNLIKAIRFCNSIIFSSHTHNENTIFNFKPFKFDGYSEKPSSYFIRFIHQDIEYEYSFSLTNSEIITEELYYYPKGRKAKIFTRDERRGELKKNKYTFSSAIKRPFDVAENTSNKTLFISRASQMDREIPKSIFRYFNENFILGYQGYNATSLSGLIDLEKDLLLEVLQIADSDIIDIELIKEKRKVHSLGIDLSISDIKITNKEDVFFKLRTYHKANPKIPFDFETEESDGTKKMFSIFLTILDIIRNNKVLLIDEIETSLHTTIIEFIINMFNAGNTAQLIYSTHNTNLLDLNKLRKDQIYFVNKKDDSSSEFYSLFDYKDFRDTMNVEKAYLQGRFDAISILTDTDKNLKQLLDG
jgi:AAA15 family ATPase/GTPase